VRVAEIRPRREIAPRIGRVRRLGGERLVGRLLVESADISGMIFAATLVANMLTAQTPASVAPEMEYKRNIISVPTISMSYLVRDIRPVHHPVKAAGGSDVLDKFSPDAMVGFLKPLGSR